MNNKTLYIFIIAILMFFVGAHPTMLKAQRVDGSYDCSSRPVEHLTFGQSSNQVSILQNFLINNNFGDFEISGYYGGMTQDAVKSFQRQIGIPRTGDLDEDSLLAIDTVCEDTTAPATPNTVSVEDTALNTDLTASSDTDSGVAVKTNGAQMMAGVMSSIIGIFSHLFGK